MSEVVRGFWASDWVERTALILQVVLLAGGLWSGNYLTALLAIPATVALVRLARLRNYAEEMSGGAPSYVAEPEEPGQAPVRYGSGGDEPPPPPRSLGDWRG